MANRTYDVIVIGTGAGGGMAIKTLCEAGLSVCALNSGRRLDPAKDFRNHKQPYDMLYRGFGDPRKSGDYYHIENEYSEGVWEHGITYTTAPGTSWEWPRCHAVGGKTNFWGRSAARMGDIDFKTASVDGGYDVDWPVTYDEIAPYYSRVERMIGVASTVQGRPSNPDGEYLPPMPLRCLDHILKSGCDKTGVPYLPDRLAQLTVPHEGHPPCHYCGNCTEGCDTGSFFSTPWFLLPAAEKTGKLELRTNAVVRGILAGDDGRAKGVAYVDRDSKQEVEVYAKAIVVAASCVESARILLNSKSSQWPNGIANSSGQAGRNLCDHLYGTTGYGYLPQLLGQPSFPDNVSASQIVWMPRWQNLGRQEEKFIRGYSIYPTGGCGEFPWFQEHIEGFGASLKTRDQAPLPDAGVVLLPDPVLAERDELRGHRSRREGRLRHPRRARPFPVGPERAAHVGAREGHDGGRDQGGGRGDLGRGEGALHAGMEPARDGHAAHGQRSEAVRDQSLRPDPRRQEPVRGGREPVPGLQRQDDHAVDPGFRAAGERVPGRGNAHGRDLTKHGPGARGAPGLVRYGRAAWTLV